MSNKKVIVFHPGHVQVAYQVALALQSNGNNYEFVSGIYYKNNFLLSIFLQIFPKKLSTYITCQLYKRKLNGLNDNHVRIYPFWEIIYLLSVRIKFLKKYSEKIMRFRNIRFDKLVSRIISKEKATIVLGYDSCSLLTFKAAKQKGIICILDQVIGHFQHGNLLLSEEKKLIPEFSDSIVLDLSDSLGERSAQEIELSDWILVASDYVKDTFIKNGVPSSKLLVCPYGVDINQFHPVNLNKNSEYFIVLFVGQLSQRKGIKYLLEAISLLNNPKIKLVLIGKIIGSGKWLKSYGDLNIEHIEKVPYSKLQEYYQLADIFVYPSLHEGSALAIYEALACGLPVIATFNSGSVLENGEEGFIIPIRDACAIAKCITILYENVEIRNHMSVNARRKAVQHTWENYRAKFINIINNID